MPAPSDRVRAKTGTPVASDFASSSDTPIVIDQTETTGTAYFQDIAGNIRELAGVNSTTWTPTDVSGASLSFTSADGLYFRFSGLVFAMGFVQYPVTASGATAKIGSLPFTVKDVPSARSGGIVAFSSEATVTSVLATRATTEFQIVAGAGVVTNATMSGDTLFFCVIYPAA